MKDQYKFSGPASTAFAAGSLLSAAGLVAILLWLLNPAGSLAAPAATTWYVNANTGDDSNNCTSPGTACKTIAAAVAKSADGDTIQIAAGVYPEHDIQIDKALTVNGAGMDATIVDAGGNGRGFWVTASSVIADLRVQNGQTSAGNIFNEGGAALLVSGVQLILQDVALVDNHAVGSGGAIFNLGELTLENTHVLSNTAEGYGGGIYNYTFGVITVTHSTLAHNTAVGMMGGGIYVGGVSLTIQDSTLADNQSGTFGGALVVSMNGNTLLDGVTLSGNRSAAGAALFAENGTITAINLTVSGNVATNNYGGIYISGPTTQLNLQNSTITNNSRTNTAGNGFNGLMIGNNAVAELSNTLLAYNQTNNCASSAPPTSLGFNLSSDFSCLLTENGDEQGIDPSLSALADYGGNIQTHALLPGSPAIDAGSDPCPATDARGIARPYDGDGDSTAMCDIGAVEARHQISIADSSVTEGNSGSVTAIFTVTLSPVHTASVSVDFATSDGSATSSDYTPQSDTLTFDPGETEKTIAITITGDTSDEFDETFTIQLSNVINADLLDASAIGTIVDNDGLPRYTIDDPNVLEGNAGSTQLQFTVTLSPASADTVTIEYATHDDTANANSDYTATSGTLTFQPGQTSKTINVTVAGDVVDEGESERFAVSLTNPTNAIPFDDDGIGMITDDDEARLSQSFGPQVYEGDSGYTPAIFTVTLTTPAAFTITVDYAVSSGYGDDGAKAGEDFVPISGTLTFLPGETVQYYTVQIIGDTIAESNEMYSSLISNANVPINANGSVAHILDDDAAPAYRIYLPLVMR